MSDKLNIKYKNRSYMLFLAVFAVVSSVRFYDHILSEYNTTLYAFSYRYGFISRGFIGTIWQWLDGHTGLQLMSYHSIYQMTFLMTALFVILVLVFSLLILKRASDRDSGDLRKLIFFMGIITFPNYWGDENFGRLDIYLMLIVMVSVMAVVAEWCEWIAVVGCAAAMCIHQGFVFTNANLILILFLYKALRSESRRRKYMVYFGLTLAVVSVLFLYFEFFSHVNGQDIYREIVSVSRSLSSDGAYNKSIVKHEILGQDVFADEWKYHIYNYQSTPIFIVLFSPFIIVGGYFLKRLCSQCTGIEKWLYRLIAMGGLTLVPEIILKVDYGRYVFYGLFYYLMVMICLLCMGDEHMRNAIGDTKALIRRFTGIPEVLYLYLMLFVPFYDILYGEMIDKIKIFIYSRL